jgi:hypothetical protein
MGWEVMPVSIEYPKKIVKITLEDGTELDVNLRPYRSEIAGNYIRVHFTMTEELWDKFWTDEDGNYVRPYYVSRE